MAISESNFCFAFCGVSAFMRCKTSVNNEGKFSQENIFLPNIEGGVYMGQFSIRTMICQLKQSLRPALFSPRGPSCGRQSPGILKKYARYGGSHGVYPNIHVKSMDSCHNRRNNKEHGMSIYPLIMHLGM